MLQLLYQSKKCGHRIHYAPVDLKRGFMKPGNISNTCNEEKTNDYENFEKGMIYMKIFKKRGVVEKRGEEETKSMPYAPVVLY
jgi:hypothetical protein